MKVLQIATTFSQACGIAHFAENLQTVLRQGGIAVDTVADLSMPDDANLVVLHYHSELLNDDTIAHYADMCRVPVILFAHDGVSDGLCNHVDGVMTMSSGLLASGALRRCVFPHPAWTPTMLEDRNALRQEFALPPDALIVGTHGFLKFERQFAEIVSALLSRTDLPHLFVELITSPWRLESPGLIAQFDDLRRRNPTRFRFQYDFLDDRALNRRLQACDLLWCWTQAPSGPYASGVISDQYASGTRIVATEKEQHWHVLNLPNVVCAPPALEPFIEQLISEIRGGQRGRHDPMPISWHLCSSDVARFLSGFVG